MLVDGIIQLITGQNPAGVDLTAYQSKIDAVVAITSTRVYPSVLPRGYQLPACAVHRYNGAQEYDLQGPTDDREDNVQIDVYGSTAAVAGQAAEAIKALLNGFIGPLPDGAHRAEACYLERDMDMPFLPQANQSGAAFRTVLGYRIVNKKV